jgi:hypothetical protein
MSGEEDFSFAAFLDDDEATGSQFEMGPSGGPIISEEMVLL